MVSGGKDVLFPEHLLPSQLQAGLREGRLKQGTFHASRENFREGYVGVTGMDKRVRIYRIDTVTSWKLYSEIFQESIDPTNGRSRIISPPLSPQWRGGGGGGEDGLVGCGRELLMAHFELASKIILTFLLTTKTIIIKEKQHHLSRGGGGECPDCSSHVLIAPPFETPM